MAFKTPTRCNNPMEPVSDSSLSTHSLQPKVVLDPNSKWIGMGSEVPWQMTRLGIEEAKRGPKNVYISSAKSEPHMARQLRRIITENLWEMGMNVIPGINKWIALTIRGTLRFFLIGMVQLGVHGFFTYVTCGRRIGDNLFSFTVGGALAFLRRYCTRI